MATVQEQDQDMSADQVRTEEIAAALLLAAIAAERFGSDMTARILARFRGMEAELVKAIVELDVSAQLSQSQQRQLMEVAEDIVLNTYEDITDDVTTDLRTVAEVTEGSVINALILILGPAYAVNFLKTVPVERLHEIADEALFEGATVAEWLEQQSNDASFRIRRGLTEALANGSSESEIIDVVRGSRESRRTDGIFQQAKRNVETLIKTAVQAVVTAARLATFEANTETVRMVGQHSIMDHRTSDICISYSGKRWSLPDYEPVGHTLPFLSGTPRHWRCRSSIIPLFGGATVPGMSYEDWLRTRPDDEQRDVLGKTKWELWKNQKLGLADLLDQRGNPISASELQRLYGRRQPE